MLKRLSTLALATLVVVSGVRAVYAQSYEVVYRFATGPGSPAGTLVQGSDGWFYGTTVGGGEFGFGTIYRVSASGESERLYSFSGGADGGGPPAGVIQGSDGAFYGSTTSGGDFGVGTIFRFDPAGTLQSLHSWGGAGEPDSLLTPLLQASDGKLYGVTFNSVTVAFRIDPVTGVYEELHRFDYSNEGTRGMSLIQGSDGFFYGTLYEGGIGANNLTRGGGAVYRMDSSGNVTVLHQFTPGSHDEYKPGNALVQAADGNFYGILAISGVDGYGAMYRMDAGGTVTVLRVFDTQVLQPHGSLPYLPPLVQAADGFFYIKSSSSTQGNGGATLLRLDTSGGMTVVHQFDWPFTCASCDSGLTIGVDGLLYSTTYSSVYRVSTAGAYEVVNGTMFSNIDGSIPTMGPTRGADGALYGTTRDGGANGFGVLYRLDTNGMLTTLHSFEGNEVVMPGPLTLGSDQWLYGTSQQGGASGCGTIFRANASGTIEVLHEFDCTDGAVPLFALLEATDGNWYGITQGGGTSNLGTIYRLGWDGTFTTLISFEDWNGAWPAGLVQSTNDGLLYGTTALGGDNGAGTIFRIDLSGSHEVLYSFGGDDGDSGPSTGFAQTADGKLIGLTDYGGAFSMTTDGVFTHLSWFDYADTGYLPYGPPSVAADGRLYATLSASDTAWGTIVRIDDDGALTVVHRFEDELSGLTPNAGLAVGGDGLAYGTTSGGGSNYSGVVFRMALPEIVAQDPLVVPDAPPTAVFDTTFTVTATGGSGDGVISFITEGPCSVWENTPDGAVIHMDSGTGVCALTARKAGDLGHAPVYSDQVLVNALRATAQPATITAFPSALYGSQFYVTINGGNGTIAVEASGACSTQDGGTLVTITGVGVCQLVAQGLGDEYYEPVSGVPAFVNAVKGAQLDLTITGVPAAVANGSTFTVGVAGGSGSGAVSFLASGACTNSGGGSLITVTSATGACRISAVKAGDASFEGAEATTTYTVLWNFTGGDDGGPRGALVRAGNGFLYGIAGPGGVNDGGSIYRVAADGTPVTVYAFSAGDAAGYSPMFFSAGRDGLLYGSTTSGAANNRGAAFRFDPVSGDVTALHAYANNEDVRGRFVQGTDGSLYMPGFKANIGGILKLDPASSALSVARPFAYLDGQPSELVQAGDGNFYGIGFDAGTGATRDGTVFRWNPTANQFSVLFEFSRDNVPDGNRPRSGLALAGDGTMYGTTVYGGIYGWGTLFSVTTDGTVTTRAAFFGAADAPTLSEASDGRIYGVTTYGGQTSVWGASSDGDGTIFRFDPATNVLTRLHTFDTVSGGFPQAGLTEGPDQALYSTTSSGGSANLGVLYKLSLGFAATAEATESTGPVAQATLFVTGAPATAVFGTTFSVDTSGGSGSGAVSFLASGACTNAGGSALIQMTSGTGDCAVTASKAGDASYLAATSDVVSTTAVKATQTTLSLTGAPLSAAYGTSFLLGASGGNGSGATNVAASGPCATVNGSLLVTVTGGTGTCAVSASKGGDQNYDAGAVSAAVSVGAVPAVQATLSVIDAPATAVNGTTFTVAAAGGTGGGALAFTASGACTNTSGGAAITINAPSGTCAIAAAKGADGNFAATQSAVVSVEAVAAPSPDPVITGVSPNFGFTSGGTVVTIRGHNFTGDATVVFDSTPAVLVVVDDAETIHATAPAHAVASVDITVTTASGSRSVVAPAAFAYGPAPAVGELGPVVRANLAATGAPAGLFGLGAAMSGNGQFVAFISADNNIVAGDTNSRADVFVRDLAAGTTEQVNLGAGGAPGAGGSGPSGPLAISSSGRYVVFATTDSLVPADGNGALDVYVRDRTNGTTERVSVKADGSSITSGVVSAGPITPDGRYALFTASGTGITANDTLAVVDVFVRDRVAGTTRMISVASNGAPAAADSTSASMSGDGRFVVFTSAASNLAGGGWSNVFVHDRDADGNGVFDEPSGSATTLVSAAAPGVGGNGPSTVAAISADGHFVVFQSSASNLVAGDSNGAADVFLFDRQTVTLSRVNRQPGGAESDAAGSLNAAGASITDDGHYVVFTSGDASLVPFDGNGAADVFRYDRLEQAVSLVSADAAGARTDTGGTAVAPTSLAASISGDGRLILFASDAANLVAGDTNGVRDLFVKEVHVNTPPGTNVVAAPIDKTTGGSPVTLQFAAVAEEGTTSLVTLVTPPTPLPAGFTVGTITYEITTTATVSGAIDLCISYAGSDVVEEASLRMLHGVNGVWEDVTTSVDTVQKLVCGRATSLSPFVLALPAAQTVSFTTPLPLSDRTFGDADFTVQAVSSVGLAVTFAEGGASQCTVSSGGVVHLTGAGACTIVASQAGTSDYRAAQAQTSFAINRAPTSVSLACPSSVTYTGAPQTPCTATVIGPALSAPAAVSYSTNIDAGTAGANASYGGGANYLASSGSSAFTIARASQTIVFAALSNRVLGDPPFAVSAAGGASGAPVTFTATPTSVCVSGGANGATISLVAAGTCTVRASQAGTANYSPADDVQRSFVVQQGATFAGLFDPWNPPGPGTYNGVTFTSGKVFKVNSTLPIKWGYAVNGALVESGRTDTTLYPKVNVYGPLADCSTLDGTGTDQVVNYAGPGSSTVTYDAATKTWQRNLKLDAGFAADKCYMVTISDPVTNLTSPSFPFKTKK